MRNEDPGEVQQKALPVCVYRELHRVAKLQIPEKSHLDQTIAWLQTLAFFWCMRSCEYSDVQGERRTKTLCVRNFRFFDRNNRDISNKIDSLNETQTVSITFEFQKREIRNDTISHQGSGDILGEGEMCPVRAAVEIVKRIYSYGIPEDETKDIQINFVKLGSLTYTIPSSVILVRLRAAVQTLGVEKLGFGPNE
jgi:hypothetical protein